MELKEHAMMLRQRSEETFENNHEYFRCSANSARVNIHINGVLFITFDMDYSDVITLCECALSAYICFYEHWVFLDNGSQVYCNDSISMISILSSSSSQPSSSPLPSSSPSSTSPPTHPHPHRQGTVHFMSPAGEN